MIEKNKTDIIIYDTETTGLDGPAAVNIDRQPYITEFYGVRLSKDFKFVDEFETMLKPPIPIPEEITKITGITQADVDNAPTFIDVYDRIYDFFENCRNVGGHNIMFDIRMLKFELFRYDLEYAFNWPKNRYCTVELSKHYFNKRLRLQQLHEHLFGVPFSGAHRARTDVEANGKCLIEMFKRGDIVWKE